MRSILVYESNFKKKFDLFSLKAHVNNTLWGIGINNEIIIVQIVLQPYSFVTILYCQRHYYCNYYTGFLRVTDTEKC